MTTVNFTIPAISCGHCLHTIRMELGQLEGVSSVEATLEDKQVSVTYAAPASEDQIIHLLQDINYPPQ